MKADLVARCILTAGLSVAMVIVVGDSAQSLKPVVSPVKLGGSPDLPTRLETTRQAAARVTIAGGAPLPPPIPGCTTIWCNEPQTPNPPAPPKPPKPPKG